MTAADVGGGIISDDALGGVLGFTDFGSETSKSERSVVVIGRMAAFPARNLGAGVAAAVADGGGRNTGTMAMVGAEPKDEGVDEMVEIGARIGFDERAEVATNGGRTTAGETRLDVAVATGR